MNKENGKRQVNIEILRIISIFMVLILHFNLNTGFFNMERFNIFFSFLEHACIIAVNIYVLITGYFMVKNKISIKKIILLELEVLFYSIVIYLIMTFAGQHKFGIKEFITYLFPITTKKYWFFTAYMGLYILSPFLNILANSMKKKQYEIFLIICTILFSGIKSLYPSNNILEGNNGFNLTWFIYLYFLAGYIRLYFNVNIKKIKLFIIYLICTIVPLLIQFILIKYFNINYVKKYLDFLIGYNNIIVLLESISFFLLFKEMDFKHINDQKFSFKLVRFFSSSVFGVYIIHEHRVLSSILWGKWLNINNYINQKEIYFIFIIDVLGIFIACTLIDKVRIKIFEAFSNLKFVKRIGTACTNLMNKELK